MNVADLLSPGVIVGSQELRRLSARVISRAEIQNNAAQKSALADFFVACANAVGANATRLTATQTVVQNGQTLVVADTTGAAINGLTATANVAGSAFVSAQLSKPVTVTE